MSKHTKIPGYVKEIHANGWTARLFPEPYPHEGLWAEMREPLPADVREGSPFTIHATKAGHVYIYWVRRLMTKRQIKKARQWGKQMADRLVS